MAVGTSTRRDRGSAPFIWWWHVWLRGSVRCLNLPARGWERVVGIAWREKEPPAPIPSSVKLRIVHLRLRVASDRGLGLGAYTPQHNNGSAGTVEGAKTRAVEGGHPTVWLPASGRRRAVRSRMEPASILLDCLG